MTQNDPAAPRVEPLPDGLCIVPDGEIDLSTSPELRQSLLESIEQKVERIVIDFSAVTYMDSSGVATLVEALQKQRSAGGKMILCALQPKVRSVFEIARLDSLFTIVDDAEAARSA